MSILRSRKFQAAVMPAAAVFLARYFGIELSDDDLMVIVAPFIAYIGGTAWEDAAAKRATVPPTPPTQLNG